MNRHTLTRSSAALALVMAFGPGAAWAGKAHEHGALKLDIAVEGTTLSIGMEAPLDNLLGFERAPRTDAERKAAADVLTRLRSPDKAPALFVPDAAEVARARTVQIGASTDTAAQVLSGLSAGERVVTSGASTLTDGQQVTTR